jgi:hypothetical protein
MFAIMSDNPIQTLIDGLVAQIEEMEKPTRPLKTAVNTLCEQAGLPPKYGDQGEAGSLKSALTLRNDQFFNRPLATCVIEIMEMRKQKGLEGATSIDEIFLALTKGGYKFETTGEDNTKRAIRISLAKNTAQFAKIGDDTFGLKKWYGMRAPRKKDNGDTGTEEEEAESTPEVVAVTEQQEPKPEKSAEPV